MNGNEVFDFWLDELQWLADESNHRKPLVAVTKRCNRNNDSAVVSVGYFDRRGLFRVLNGAFVRAGFKWADDNRTGFKVGGCGLDRIRHALDELVRISGIKFASENAKDNFMDYNIL